MTHTHLGTIKTDPEIANAKEMLLRALKKHQKNLTGVRPPNPELIPQYQEALKRAEKYRGAKLWYPYLGSGIGNGPLVELLDGSVKYDFIGGIGVHHFGHSHPEIIASSIDAAMSDIVMQGHLQQNNDQIELIELFVKESGLPHCFLTTSGAMANENGIKIAFQKNFPARRVLTFERAFCGRTLAMAQITEKHAVRDGLPSTLEVDYVPFYDPQDPEGSTKRAVEMLKRYLWRHPKEYACMIMELIQGEGGYYPGSTHFFRTLMEILKEHHVAIFVDEIQSFGRTSRFFAFQHFGLEDLVDIVTIGKLSQVCATLYNETYNPRPGLLSQTFSSSSAALHASKTMIQLMINEQFFGLNGKNMQVNERFVKNFKEIQERHPKLISGPYGVGAMVAFTPLDGSLECVKALATDLFHAGVLCFICGKDPTRIRFLAPVGAIIDDDIDAVCAILEKTLTKS